MTTTAGDVTTGELGRRFDRFEGTITTALENISNKLDQRPALTDVQNMLAPLERRVSALEGWQTWALRLGAPGIVGALVGVLINGARIG